MNTQTITEKVNSAKVRTQNEMFTLGSLTSLFKEHRIPNAQKLVTELKSKEFIVRLNREHCWKSENPITTQAIEQIYPVCMAFKLKGNDQFAVKRAKELVLTEENCIDFLSKKGYYVIKH